jgi:hypothetical protein
MRSSELGEIHYLLNAKAYGKDGTITRSDVKKNMPEKWKQKSDGIYISLKDRKLVQPVDKAGNPTTTDGRFCITDKGLEALVGAMLSTEFRFTARKGPKILNALLDFIKMFAEDDSRTKQADEMSFEEFEERFRALYLEERKRQELKGVVSIHGQDLCDKFAEQYRISETRVGKLYSMLKESGKITTVMERGNELIQWVE